MQSIGAIDVKLGIIHCILQNLFGHLDLTSFYYDQGTISAQDHFFSVQFDLDSCLVVNTNSYIAGT